MRFSAWADPHDGAGSALVYRDQAKLLVPGEEGRFWPLDRPGAGFAVRVGREPPEPWDGSTVRVRFHAARGVTLPANATGSVKFATRLRHDLVIREGAVLRSPEGPYVLVATNERHTLTKRRVEIGSITYGYAAVVSGLKEDEWVVALHAFALDTARRLGWRSQ
jgi:multidrug efflux pump subunit AcrA (membrane-fusion protein)